VLERQLGDLAAVGGAFLADLFALAAGEEPGVARVRNVLQNDLLRRTLQHARAHTRYYGTEPAYAEWRQAQTGDPVDLGGLPFVDRALMAGRLHDFRADDVRLRSVSHTSGTTGLALDVYKSFEEIAVINDFYAGLSAPAIRTMISRPLVLSFPNVHHGAAVPMPGIGMTFVGGVTEDGLLHDAFRVLDTAYDIEGHDERISLISGLDHHVMLFTAFLLEQGISPARYGLNAITVTGGFISRYWLRFLETTWDCTVNDRFTLTEAIGGASRLHGSDTFLLDTHLIAEVVDPSSGRALETGTGLLAITNLYPFVQMQPTIRYLTGDVVRRVPGPGRLRFRFLGKQKNCIFRERAGSREWLLFSAALNDALHAFPDVRTFDRYANVESVHDRSLGSLPVVKVESRRDGDRLIIRLTIELRYAPHGRPERVAALQDRLVAELRGVPGTALSSGLDRGDVELEIIWASPGASGAPPVVKI
jgi:hypothetical protein